MKSKGFTLIELMIAMGILLIVFSVVFSTYLTAHRLWRGGFTQIAFQFVVNIGMTFGLCPVTGLPLPFISYGGSSLVSFLFAMGLVLGVERRKL